MKLREIFNDVRTYLAGALADSGPLLWETQKKHRDFLSDYLAQHGFRFLNNGAFSFAYVNEELHGGIVIKISFCGVNTPDLENHPYLRAVWVKPLFCSKYVMVQPLCNRDDAEDAQRQIYRIITADPRNRNHDASHDMHHNNVGWYRGKPVSFDICSEIYSTWPFWVTG